jgi:cbb3-type cytochrome oxidase maturation protein
MTIVYLLVPLALILAGAAVIAFVWSARQGQLDDLVTPAIRMLHDDEPEPGSNRAGSDALPDDGPRADPNPTKGPHGRR